MQAVPVLGVWLGWGGHYGEAEKPPCPAVLHRGALAQMGKRTRGSLLYEGHGTERRWTSFLPGDPDMKKEEEEAAVA